MVVVVLGEPTVLDHPRLQEGWNNLAGLPAESSRSCRGHLAKNATSETGLSEDDALPDRQAGKDDHVGILAQSCLC